MQRFVIAYDIPNTKRRNKIATVLEKYGIRVNYSVFEVQIKSNALLKELEDELLQILKPKDDSLRVYYLCQKCVEKSWCLGEEPSPFQRDTAYFI